MDEKKDKAKSGSHGRASSLRGMIFTRRVGILTGAMCNNDLTDLTWPELEKRVPRQMVRGKDEHPPPDQSDSDDDEEMESYPKLFRQLLDTSVVRPADKDAGST